MTPTLMKMELDSQIHQFCTYLEFRGEKYLNTFIVTNANDCPNLLSYGATFRMGVLLPNYPEENIVKGENVPNFKMNTCTSDGTSNIFQILQDLQQKQYQYNSNKVPNTVHTTNIVQMAQPETGDFFQDHHTLCTSYYNSKTGQSSAGTQKYFMSLVQSKGSITLKPFAPDVTLRLVGIAAVLLSLSKAW